jgi:hypothetical protein
MSESFTARAVPSKVSVEQTFRRSPRPYKKNRFGTIVRALWPDKPALNLAQRLGCSERAAQFYIDGERKVTARAVAIIIAEMLD